MVPIPRHSLTRRVFVRFTHGCLGLSAVVLLQVDLRVSLRLHAAIKVGLGVDLGVEKTGWLCLGGGLFFIVHVSLLFELVYLPVGVLYLVGAEEFVVYEVLVDALAALGAGFWVLEEVLFLAGLLMVGLYLGGSEILLLFQKVRAGVYGVVGIVLAGLVGSEYL